MSKRYRYVLLVFLSVLVGAASVSFLSNNSMAVLNPAGWVAAQQKSLMITTLLLMLIVVLPVFAMTFLFAWKYRESNTSARYTPEWDGNKYAEAIWWIIPLVIISFISVLIWKSSHELDPFKPLQADRKPVTVQVVALEWKWLFIYPEYDIASVNYLKFPAATPVNFEITADAPMNSFWIPKLGGQVYAMAGMETKLHLIADNEGIFEGSSANLSGKGFAGMKFRAEASSDKEFETWIAETKKQLPALNQQAYEKLAEPSDRNPAAYYSTVDKDLFENIIMKYMKPNNTDSTLPLTEEAHGH